MRQLSQNAVFAALSLLLVASTALAAQKAKNPEPSFWTLTYLKAKPNQGARLTHFLEKNWLELDRIAVEKKLIKQYRLVRNAKTDEQYWDVVVAVEYNNELLYDGIHEEFETIRSRHKTALIDGLNFKELGDIVKSATSAAFDENEAIKQAPDYAYSVQQWRSEREATLKSENGWLSLAGLFWLKQGANTVGADKKNAVILPSANGAVAARIGTIQFDGKTTKFLLENGVKARADGKVIEGEIAINNDDGQPPTIVEIGGIKFHVVKRGARYGVRVKDPNSTTRRDFTGLKWFPVNSEFTIKARFETYPEPKEVFVPNILGDTSRQKSPGLLVFQLGGKEYRLEPVGEGKRLFIVFRDLTSRTDTYQVGRFLYADVPENGSTVILDFNRAENPPCAFTEFATCPLPSAQNQLQVAIPAGEKRYH
ncbi:MAG: DUF1684 domain-containing protein [Ignavibacteria bacterium]|nr:DUF1684 domain-containing protein [Ignavibacteria bacterium]